MILVEQWKKGEKCSSIKTQEQNHEKQWLRERGHGERIHGDR